MNYRALAAFLFTLAVTVSCAYRGVGGVSGKATEMLSSTASETTETLTILSAVGGICLLAGMVLLVITAGKKGWYPVIGGVSLVLLNYAVAEYSHLLFYPLVICTGLISATWTYRIVKQILIERHAK
jgi:hypothetical protein